MVKLQKISLIVGWALPTLQEIGITPKARQTLQEIGITPRLGDRGLTIKVI